MQLFRDVIDEIGFMDLGYVGQKYTWSKHFEDGHSIWKRLDRGMATTIRFEQFPGSRITHLPRNSSDYSALLINPSGLELPKSKKLFRFEEMWLSDTTCGETVEAAWINSGGSDIHYNVLTKVKKYSKDLEWWNKNIFGNVRMQLEEKKKLLKHAEAEAVRGGNNNRIRSLKSEIDILLDKESYMWGQRSRVLWLGNGDRNSKFFHTKATLWYKKNYIQGLKDSNGRWRDQPEEIEGLLSNYFTEIFTIARPNIQQGALDYIPQVVSDEINDHLTGEFMAREVSAALKQMAPQKAPGLDGVPPLFFQHFWGLMDHEVTQTILASLNLGTLPYPINHIFITLIPKVKNLEYVTDFHPIKFV